MQMRSKKVKHLIKKKTMKMRVRNQKKMMQAMKL